MKKYGTLHKTDNPADPEVLVQGYGKMKLSQLQKQVKDRAKEFYDMILREDYHNAAYVSYETHGTFIVFLRALDDVMKEIEKLSSLAKK